MLRDNIVFKLELIKCCFVNLLILAFDLFTCTLSVLGPRQKAGGGAKISSVFSTLQLSVYYKEHLSALKYCSPAFIM